MLVDTMSEQALLDRLGRVLIPKPLRQSLGLQEGTLLEIEEEGGALRLRAVQPEPELVREGRVLVYHGTALSDLEAAVEAQRAERGQQLAFGRSST
ncbi:MAG TPA: AbrB/MazE/SpoVT family DNA-binding domain-containing protein [Thermoanaerobaculia bacterium]|nr:AbrB/MazE/SpoVT family DNA-binding domain-containing protein [Thermoanaerobaculia bacterium]